MVRFTRLALLKTLLYTTVVITAAGSARASHPAPPQSSKERQTGERADPSQQTGRTPSRLATPIEHRIRAVENGLVPLIIVEGETQVRRRLLDRMKDYQVPGVSIAVINGGRIEWARGYGVMEAGSARPVTPETMFEAGSISKPVAAVGALRLVVEGKLNLDEDVNRYLISWKIPVNEFSKRVPVTIRRILSHTAGLNVHGFPGYVKGSAIPTLLQTLNGEAPANNPPIVVDTLPGTKRRYSGGGYMILQQLLTDVTSRTFPDYMKEAVFDKIGMRNSTYEQDLPSEFKSKAATGHLCSEEIAPGKWNLMPEMAAGGLWTTPSDLSRFAIEIQKCITGKSDLLLSKDMCAEMTKSQAELIDHWGLGFAVDGSGTALRFSHAGADVGYKNLFVAYGHTGQGAVIMTNGNNGSNLAKEIMMGIARVYGWRGYDGPERRSRGRIDAASYPHLAGRYKNHTVTTEDEKLFISTFDGTARLELVPESTGEYSESRFFVQGTPGQVTFLKNRDGQVTGLLYETGYEGNIGFEEKLI